MARGRRRALPRGPTSGGTQVWSAELAPVSDPDLSVVICTLNRKDLLLDAIRSVTDDIGTQKVEVIVVDNGSTDGSVVAVEEMARVDGRVTLVREPRLGLSQARNTGSSVASGKVVAFLDDDAVVAPGWTGALLDVFAATPDIAAVGGRSTLAWPHNRRPGWLPERYESYYSGVDYGPERILLEPPRIPYGVNMALDRSWLDRLGGFDTRLGRKGHSLISCEEQDLFLRLRAAGGQVWYEPGAAVYHRVDPSRARRSWVIRRAFAQGQTHGLAPLLRVALLAPDSQSSDRVAELHPKPALLYRLLLRGAYEAGRLVGSVQRSVTSGP